MNEPTCCPNCERETNAEELRESKGVCEPCRRSFQAADSGWLAGKPSRADEAKPVQHGCETHFDGVPCETTDFDLAAVEKSLCEFEGEPEDAQARVADELAKIFVYVWPPRGQSAASAFLRFTAFCAVVRPDLCTLNGTQIAKALCVRGPEESGGHGMTQPTHPHPVKESIPAQRVAQ
jgi:hypothetical protein